jgi:hypothetical protein
MKSPTYAVARISPLAILFLLLPIFLFPQDTLLLKSGEKIVYDAIHWSRSHAEYEVGGVRIALPKTDLEKIVRRVPKFEFCGYYFWGIGGMGDKFSSLATSFPKKPSNYSYDDWERGTHNMPGGAFLQCGFRSPAGHFFGMMAGMTSVGSLRRREYYNTSVGGVTSYYSFNIRIEHFHFAVSPFYRAYSPRNNAYLEFGPYLGILHYELLMNYSQYEPASGIDINRSDKRNDRVFHPGIIAGAGWNFAHGPRFFFALVTQCHVGFGVKIEALGSGAAHSYAPLQLVLGLRYGFR